MFADLLKRRNAFGMLSEDIHPATGELWGNLPQTYSMAGIVNTARILSRSWQEAWARALSIAQRSSVLHCGTFNVGLERSPATTAGGYHAAHRGRMQQL